MIKKSWLLKVLMLMNLILSTLFLLLNTNVKQLILSHDLYQCQLKWGLAQEFLKVKNTVSYSVSAHGAGFFFFFLIQRKPKVSK